MNAFEQFLVGFCKSVFLSYRSSFLGLLVAIAGAFLMAAQSYPNHYVALVAVLIFTPFAAWRDQRVKDGTLKLFIMAAIFFLPFSARAEEQVVDPAVSVHPLASAATFTVGGKIEDVAPAPAPADPAPAPTPTTPQIGGCFGSSKFCIGPTVALSLAAINLTTKKVEGAFSPGAGLGLTYGAGTWQSIGIAGYLNLDPGANNASFAVLLSVLNGYARFGYAKGFIGDTSTRLLVGTGIDL